MFSPAELRCRSLPWLYDGQAAVCWELWYEACVWWTEGFLSPYLHQLDSSAPNRNQTHVYLLLRPEQTGFFSNFTASAASSCAEGWWENSLLEYILPRLRIDDHTAERDLCVSAVSPSPVWACCPSVHLEALSLWSLDKRCFVVLCVAVVPTGSGLHRTATKTLQQLWLELQRWGSIWFHETCSGQTYSTQSCLNWWHHRISV